MGWREARDREVYCERRGAEEGRRERRNPLAGGVVGQESRCGRQLKARQASRKRVLECTGTARPLGNKDVQARQGRLKGTVYWVGP